MNQFYRVVNGFLEELIITLTQNRKLIFRHLLILFPATIYLGMICFIGKDSPAEYFIESFQTFTFLLAGIIHLYLLYKKITPHRFRFFPESIFYTFFAAVVICITLLFFYLFTDNSMAVMAFNSAVAFALPHVSRQALDIYKHIPRRQYPLWTEPLKKNYNNEVLIPEVVSIQFLLVAERKGMKDRVFLKTVPEGWKLGKAFYSIIRDNRDNPNNRNSMIGYSEESGNLYAWEFYIRTILGFSQRRLEPEESLFNNRVGRKPKIYVKRVHISGNALQDIHMIYYKTITDSPSTLQPLDKNGLKFYNDNHKN